MGKNDDWGPPVSGFGGRETPGNYYPDAVPSTALVPSNSNDERPTFTAEELALIDPGGATLDDEDRAKYKKLLADGLMTPEDSREALRFDACRAGGVAGAAAEF